MIACRAFRVNDISRNWLDRLLQGSNPVGKGRGMQKSSCCWTTEVEAEEVADMGFESRGLELGRAGRLWVCELRMIGVNNL